MAKANSMTTKIKGELELTQDLEKELTGLDESMLPTVIAERIDNIAEINEKCEIAIKKKEEAQSKVNSALDKADKLLSDADSLGKLDAETHKFLKLEWSTKGDRIAALERCVKVIGESGGETLSLQKSIIEIQNATLQSQEAIMEVQKYQMAYMEGTTKALKFLYGLSAYSIASTESIVTNMELILSGEKRKDLGEMAKQQMYLVMDQLKSQENLQRRMQKHEEIFDDFQEQLRLQNEKDEKYEKALAEQLKIDDKQNRDIAIVKERTDEQDRNISEGIKKDKEQDTLLDSHEQKLRDGVIKDKEQDELLELHEQKLSDGITKDIEQDKTISELVNSNSVQNETIKEQAKEIALGIEKDKDQDHNIQLQQNKISEIELSFEKTSLDIQKILQEIERIDSCLETKANMKTQYLALAISLIALILSVISLFT